MPFPLARSAELQPVLVHVTRPTNLPHIRAVGGLFPAVDLVGPDAPPRLLPRPDAVLLPSGVLLNDQKPLDPRYLDFDAGWTLPRWLDHLDRRVFFWPGTAAGPVPHGRRHLFSYAAHGGVVLTLPTTEVFALNPDAVWEFARVNSGTASPRSRPNRRGDDTFLPCDRFPGTAADVVEVTAVGRIILPAG